MHTNTTPNPTSTIPKFTTSHTCPQPPCHTPINDTQNYAIKGTMPQTDEAKAFFHAVYSAVAEIPSGSVTTYGHIAALIGTRTCTM